MTVDDTSMINATFPAVNYPEMWDNLWKARLVGTDPLQKALEKPVHPNIPQDREAFTERLLTPSGRNRNEHFLEATIKNYHAALKIDPSLSTYNDLSGKPGSLFFSILSIGSLFSLFCMNPLSEHLGFSIPLVTNVMAGTAVAVGSALNAARIQRASTRERENYYQTVICPETPHAFFLFTAGFAVYMEVRAAETHCMALVACAFLDQNDMTPDTEKKNILVKLAEERGSHHAAHALWLIQQKSPDSSTHFTPFSSVKFDDLIDKTKRNEPVAGDRLNLLLRLRPDLRREFLGRRQRPQEENFGRLASFYDLAINLEKI